MSCYRKILLPLVPIYGCVTWTRNKLYDHQILPSVRFDFPIVSVGNLSTGGTGKSPMVEYLIRLLQDRYAIATLSRGYGRVSKGFYEVSKTDTADQFGDEPLQFKKKFHDITVAVDENRVRGIKKLMALSPHTQLVILDDAFQHRSVKAGLYILLTTYDALFMNDCLLPAGNLRESKKGVQRAQIIVVTKCPKNISMAAQNKIRTQMQLDSDQKLFFSYIAYDQSVYRLDNKKDISEFRNTPFSLVTGIANPKPLLKHYKKLKLPFSHLSYPDHHRFSAKDLQELKSKSILITTEKDYTRLSTKLNHPQLWYQPIEASFVTDQEDFDQAILDFMAGYTISANSAKEK